MSDPPLNIPLRHRDAISRLIESPSSLLISIIGATVDFQSGEAFEHLADVLIERVPKSTNVDFREVADAMGAIHLMRTTYGFSVPEASRLIVDTINAHRGQQRLPPVGASQDQALAVMEEVVHAASATLEGSDVSTAEIYREESA